MSGEQLYVNHCRIYILKDILVIIIIITNGTDLETRTSNWRFTVKKAWRPLVVFSIFSERLDQFG